MRSELAHLVKAKQSASNLDLAHNCSEPTMGRAYCKECGHKSTVHNFDEPVCSATSNRSRRAKRLGKSATNVVGLVDAIKLLECD